MRAKVSVVLELSPSDASWLRGVLDNSDETEIDADLWADPTRERLHTLLDSTIKDAIETMGGTV